MRNRVLCFLSALVLFLSLPLSFAQAEALGFTVYPQTLRPGKLERISFSSPAQGSADLSLFSAAGENLFTIRSGVSAAEGVNHLTWDGMDLSGNPVAAGDYLLCVSLNGESVTVPLSIGEPSPAILSLSCAGTMTIGKEWSVTLEVSQPGTLSLRGKVSGQDSWRQIFSREIPGGESIVSWDGTVDGQEVESGLYTMQFTLSDASGFSGTARQVSVEVLAPQDTFAAAAAAISASPGRVVTPGTAISEDENNYWTLPVGEMNEQAIWDIMMQPMVVIEGNQKEVYRLRRTPDNSSSADNIVGEITYASQGLHILETRDDGWTLVEAFNSSYGPDCASRRGYGVTDDLIRGYVKTSLLKTITPREEYGLLIDKKKQTMSVFRQGKRIETLLVSTGRAEENHFDRETAAGCFLTGLHRVDFSTQGLKYDFVIQYDGGNLLHQIPYSSDGKRDFTKGIIYLGTKASHACIRIQNHPGDQSGINAYWIWTHIPYRTRVIILDDPEECAAEKARLSGSAPVKRESFISCGDSFSDDAIVITFAGDVIPVCSGDSLGFDAYFRKYGAGYMLGGLRELFEKDDLTSLSLACVLKEDTSGSIKMRGLPEYAEIFENNSVEMISLGDEHLYDYREGGYEATVSAIGNKVLWTGQNHSQTVMIKGTIFGFATCSEKDYQVDTGIIGQKIRELRDKGCEYVIMQCHWGNEKDIKYGKNQEAMARACVREGADLVIGRHPDAVQGIGDIDGVPVIYSLGRLVVDRTVRRKTYDSLAVQAAFYPHERKKTEIRLIPLFSSSSVNEKANDCRPVPAENTEKKRILEMIQADTGFEITESDKP